MDIWNLYEHQDVFLKYFPALENETEIEYQYRILEIPGLFSTSLEVDNKFLLSNDELIIYLRSKNLIKYNSNISFLTRLSCYYIDQFSEKTKDEFYRYLDRFTILSALRIIYIKYENDELYDYFSKRWQKGIEEYQDIVEELFSIRKEINPSLINPYLENLLIDVFLKLTKENNIKEIQKSIYVAEKIYLFPWVDALVPYGSDQYLDFVLTKQDYITSFYTSALKVSKDRLDYIINYLAKDTSYYDQLLNYLSLVDDDFLINEEYEEQYLDRTQYLERSKDLKIFLTIVSEIIRLGNINYKIIPMIRGSRFEIWVDRTENQV